MIEPSRASSAKNPLVKSGGEEHEGRGGESTRSREADPGSDREPAERRWRLRMAVASPARRGVRSVEER
ncbi:unnamed protein product [Lampetra fluviatilis]